MSPVCVFAYQIITCIYNPDCSDDKELEGLPAVHDDGARSSSVAFIHLPEEKESKI